MRLAAGVVLFTLTQVHGLSAQANRIFYLGATAGVEVGSRDDIHVGSVSTLGGLFGVRLSPGWSVEFEIDRGSAYSDVR